MEVGVEEALKAMEKIWWERDVSRELGKDRFGWGCEKCGWKYWIRVWEVGC